MAFNFRVLLEQLQDVARWSSRNSHRNSCVDDMQLDTLSVAELRELKDTIDDAVRAVIRERNKPKPMVTAATTSAAPILDLASEASAWLAARRR
jgi:hypothetical protein